MFHLSLSRNNKTIRCDLSLHYRGWFNWFNLSQLPFGLLLIKTIKLANWQFMASLWLWQTIWKVYYSKKHEFNNYHYIGLQVIFYTFNSICELSKGTLKVRQRDGKPNRWRKLIELIRITNTKRLKKRTLWRR